MVIIIQLASPLLAERLVPIKPEQLIFPLLLWFPNPNPARQQENQATSLSLSALQLVFEC